MRRCIRCGLEKPAIDFHKGKPSRPCKSCRKLEAAVYYTENKTAILARNAAWEESNPEKRAASHKRWLEKNAKREKERHAAEYQRKKEHFKLRNAKRYADNPKNSQSESYASHKRRLARDPAYKLRNLITKYIGRVLKGKKGGRKTKELVGYDISELRTHLERLFSPGMTWKNHGRVWEIDHIKPVSSFDFNDEKQVAICWSLKNLRPLEKQLNRAKGARIVATELETIAEGIM
jgi:hypothetical protein